MEQMQIEVSELRKRKLFIGCPMYGGQCAGMFTKSMCDLSNLCTQYGIELRSYFLFNESLITRARSYVADEFMRSGFTHLLFIDSDIGFDPHDVIGLLAMQSDDSPYDILAGTYPKKTISWEKIRSAVNKGFADEDPNALDQFVGDFVFNPVVEPGKVVSIPLNEPAEVLETGTGFMMIRRKTFERYTEAYPHYHYRPDHIRTEAFDGTREIMLYFQCEIDPVTKRYLSEDYLFCQNVRKAGMKVFVCPWMKLLHVGSYIFGGSLAAMAAIGESPTADAAKVGRNSKNKK